MKPARMSRGARKQAQKEGEWIAENYAVVDDPKRHRFEPNSEEPERCFYCFEPKDAHVTEDGGASED